MIWWSLKHEIQLSENSEELTLKRNETMI